MQLNLSGVPDHAITAGPKIGCNPKDPLGTRLGSIEMTMQQLMFLVFMETGTATVFELVV